MLSGLGGAADHARRLEALGVDGAFTFGGRHDGTVMCTIAAVGTPNEVAADAASRFGGRSDRVGFYTSSPVVEETLAELVAALRPTAPAGSASRGPRPTDCRSTEEAPR